MAMAMAMPTTMAMATAPPMIEDGGNRTLRIILLVDAWLYGLDDTALSINRQCLVLASRSFSINFRSSASLSAALIAAR